jgi:hypothetical protein
MTICIIHLVLLATPAGMRENNKNNQLHCQPTLNVVVEIKGPFLGSVKPRTLDTDMIWRYRKRLRITQGVSLNLGKTGALVSIGVRGGRVTHSRRGRRATIGLPSSGLFVHFL